MVTLHRLGLRSLFFTQIPNGYCMHFLDGYPYSNFVSGNVNTPLLVMFISKCYGGNFSLFCGTSPCLGLLVISTQSSQPTKDDAFLIVSVLCCRAPFRKSRIFSLSTRNTICPVTLPSAPRLDYRQSTGAILR